MINIISCSLPLAQICVRTPWLSRVSIGDLPFLLSRAERSHFQMSYAQESRKSDADHLCLLL